MIELEVGPWQAIMFLIFQVRNDHTYVQRPQESLDVDDDDDADLDRPVNASQDPTSSGSNSNLLGNHNNMDIVLLSRHIAHMQRICRTSLQVTFSFLFAQIKLNTKPKLFYIRLTSTMLARKS